MLFRASVLAVFLVSALLVGAFVGREEGNPAFARAQNAGTVIPEKLRPYLQDYVAPGSALRAGFVPYKPQIVWGEPLEVTFRVENLGPKDFKFGFGGDNRGTGRHDRFKILVTDAAGKPLVDPHANAPNFGGILTNETLAPGGPRFQHKIDLAQFRTFAKPGEYTVTCSFAFDEPFTAVKDAPAKPVVSTRFRLTIVERTPERVVAVLEEMTARAQAASLQELPAELERIARFGREDAVPQLTRLARSGAVERRAAAVAVLPLVPGPAAMDAAIVALQDAEPAIRKTASGALGTMAQPRAVEALLEALRREKGPVTGAILAALGATQSDRALPVIVDALDHGSAAMRQAAIIALVAYGGEGALTALERYVTADDLTLRMEAILACVEKLQQPLKREWLFPILRGRTQSQQWLESLRLVRMYGGEQAIPTLCGCLDFDAPWSGRNAWILFQVQACPNAPPTEYTHDWNREGTPDELETNRRTLANLKRLAAPLPLAPTRPPLPPLPLIKTDPPIDFTPRLKAGQDSAEITSGFLHLTIRRNGYQLTYSPSEEHRAMYDLGSRIRALLQHPDRYAVLGITAAQAEQIRTLSPPLDAPDLSGSTMLYMIYRESPSGPLQQEAADDLNRALQSRSQGYHAAVAAFVSAARKILTPGQLERL